MSLISLRNAFATGIHGIGSQNFSAHISAWARMSSALGPHRRDRLTPASTQADPTACSLAECQVRTGKADLIGIAPQRFNILPTPPRHLFVCARLRHTRRSSSHRCGRNAATRVASAKTHALPLPNSLEPPTGHSLSHVDAFSNSANLGGTEFLVTCAPVTRLTFGIKFGLGMRCPIHRASSSP